MKKLAALLLLMGSTFAFADDASDIAAWQKKIDDELRKADISPFTATEAIFLEVGETIRLGSDGKTVTKNPQPGLPAMAALAFEDGSFFVGPVTGARPAVVRRADAESGTLVPGDGEAVATKRRLGDDEILTLDRFIVLMSPQSGMGRALVHDPDSPARKSFGGLKWFPPNPALLVRAKYTPDPKPQPVKVATSRGLEKTYFRAGTFQFTIDGAQQTLVALAGSATPKAGDDLFVPFRDATSGKESYGAARYLNLHVPEKADAVIDFNRASNPNCNYSPHYNCPLPPKENTLTAAVRAGEMAYPSDHH